jgi:hypothetical protein
MKKKKQTTTEETLRRKLTEAQKAQGLAKSLELQADQESRSMRQHLLLQAATHRQRAQEILGSL